MGTCPISINFNKIIRDAMEFFIKLLIYKACEKSNIKYRLNIKSG